MQVLQLILDFVVQLVEHGAWPTVILLLLLIFRRHLGALLADPLSQLITRMTKVGGKRWSAEFTPPVLPESETASSTLQAVSKPNVTWEQMSQALAGWARWAGMYVLYLGELASTRRLTNVEVGAGHHALSELREVATKMKKEDADSKAFADALTVARIVERMLTRFPDVAKALAKGEPASERTH